jgi:hypothetical protein
MPRGGAPIRPRPQKLAQKPTPADTPVDGTPRGRATVTSGDGVGQRVSPFTEPHLAWAVAMVVRQSPKLGAVHGE